MIKLLFIPFLIISCEFEPTGVYELKSNVEPKEPEIEMISLDLSQDTIVQYYDKAYNFKLYSNKKIYSTRIWLDQKQVFNQPAGNGVFNIKNEDFSEGYHTLKIEVNTETGTNSIADQLQVETFQLYTEMTIYIRRKFSGEASTSLKNKHLVVSWDKYEAPDLLHYQIKKSVCGKEYDYAIVKGNEFIDSLYVGEMAHYYIYSIPEDSTKIKRWASTWVDQNLPAIFTTATNKNEYTLSWKLNFMPGNISHFEIAKMVNNRMVALGSVDKNVQSFKIEDAFGTKQTYSVRIIPEAGFSGSNPRECLEALWSGYLGDRFAKGSVNEMFDMEDNGITYYINDSIYHFSFQTNEVASKREVDLSNFSSNGNFKASPKGQIIRGFSDHELELYYPKEGLRLQKISLQKYTTTSPRGIVISDVGIGVINHYNQKFSLINFNTGNVLATNAYYNVNCISPDGKYLLVKNDSLRLLKYDNGSLSTIYKIPTEDINSTLGFFGDDSGYFYYQNGWNLEIMDCVSLAHIGSYSINGERITDFDFENKRLLTFKMTSPYKYSIRDLISGKVIKTIENSTNTMHLCGNRLVSKTGVMYYLETLN